MAEMARDMAEKIHDRVIEGLAVNDLSRLDSLAGDFDAAIARETRALELASDSSQATNLIIMWLGFNYLSRGDLDNAEERFEARLEMARRYVQRDQEAFTRLGLADVKLARGDRDSARAGYEAAAQALQRGAQLLRCIAEQRIGRMDLEDGHLDQAVVHFETMGNIAAAWHNPECEAEARAGMADVAARRGDLETADAEARRVVDLTEQFRHAGVNLESRALGFGALAPAYERAIAISMQRAERGDSDAAGTRADAQRAGARARVARQGRRKPPRRAGRVCHRALPRSFDACATNGARVWPNCRWRCACIRTRRRRSRSWTSRTTSRFTCAISRRRSMRPIRGTRRSSGRGRYRSEAIQALLDDDTVLLEYALGDARSYLWVVSKEQSRAFTARASRGDRNARATGARASSNGRRVRQGRFPHRRAPPRPIDRP